MCSSDLRVLTPADLDRADGVALVSSLRGWRTAVLATTPATSPLPVPV